MRQQANQHGMFQGKQMETLLAQNPQYTKMIAEKYGRETPEQFYEEDSITPISKEQYSINRIREAIEAAKRFLRKS